MQILEGASLYLQLLLLMALVLEAEITRHKRPLSS